MPGTSPCRHYRLLLVIFAATALVGVWTICSAVQRLHHGVIIARPTMNKMMNETSLFVEVDDFGIGKSHFYEQSPGWWGRNRWKYVDCGTEHVPSSTRPARSCQVLKCQNKCRPFRMQGWDSLLPGSFSTYGWRWTLGDIKLLSHYGVGKTNKDTYPQAQCASSLVDGLFFELDRCLTHTPYGVVMDQPLKVYAYGNFFCFLVSAICKF